MSRPDWATLLREGADTQHTVTLTWQEAQAILDRIEHVEERKETYHEEWMICARLLERVEDMATTLANDLAKADAHHFSIGLMVGRVKAITSALEPTQAGAR